MGGYHSPADTPDRVEAATLVAICRLVVATAWLSATTSPKLSSLIGD
jgi:aminopeptidase YwaD